RRLPRLRARAPRRPPRGRDRSGRRISGRCTPADRQHDRLGVGDDDGAEGRLRGAVRVRRGAARVRGGTAGPGEDRPREDSTMAHVYIEDIGRHEGEEVTIKGWLHNRRSSGKIHFLILRDGTGFIQGVMSKAAVGEELFKAADHLSQETSVIVTGAARADTRAPNGFEIDVKSFEIVGESHDYPITPKEHGVDYLLDRRHLWLRSERQ